MNAIISNEDGNTLSAKLKEVLPKCDRIDALVGYFFLPSFLGLVDVLEGVRMRVLIGMDVDWRALGSASDVADCDLDLFVRSPAVISRVSARERYIKDFVSTLCIDSEESERAFAIFLRKVQDGTLEIRKTMTRKPGKDYIFHNQPDESEKTGIPGIVITGLSNLCLKHPRGHGRTLTEPRYYNDSAQSFEKVWDDDDTIVIAGGIQSEAFVRKVRGGVTARMAV